MPTKSAFPTETCGFGVQTYHGFLSDEDEE